MYLLIKMEDNGNLSNLLPLMTTNIMQLCKPIYSMLNGSQKLTLLILLQLRMQLGLLTQLLNSMESIVFLQTIIQKIQLIIIQLLCLKDQGALSNTLVLILHILTMLILKMNQDIMFSIMDPPLKEKVKVGNQLITNLKILLFTKTNF